MMTSNGNSNRILRRVLAATALVAVGFICTARAADRDPRDSAPPDAIPEAVKKAIAFDKIGKKADKPYRIAYLTECVTNTYCEARMKGLQEAADKYGFTFATAGSFEYFCGLHPHMKGKVIVTQ